LPYLQIEIHHLIKRDFNQALAPTRGNAPISFQEVLSRSAIEVKLTTGIG
jgi:hypothetical protein